MKLLRLAALAAAVSLAACTSSPTDPARAGAATPSFDGGNGMGSGNYADTNDPGANSTSSDSTGTGDNGTQRGVNLLGSGT